MDKAQYHRNYQRINKDKINERQRKRYNENKTKQPDLDEIILKQNGLYEIIRNQQQQISILTNAILEINTILKNNI